jgi:hypothetical protein
MNALELIVDLILAIVLVTVVVGLYATGGGFSRRYNEDHTNRERTVSTSQVIGGLPLLVVCAIPVIGAVLIIVLS